MAVDFSVSTSTNMMLYLLINIEVGPYIWSRATSGLSVRVFRVRLACP